jgi:hypothetical protein
VPRRLLNGHIVEVNLFGVVELQPSLTIKYDLVVDRAGGAVLSNDGPTAHQSAWQSIFRASKIVLLTLNLEAESPIARG